MRVDPIRYAIRYNALKTNMFLVILANMASEVLTMHLGIYDGHDTVCDSDNFCNDNYYVSDHECIECAPGTYNSSGDDASGPDTVCDTMTRK